ncbi:hypothetical protein [Granulicella paludicola]|uniref:hypothetical protein n=1 Tax=Granulicella paludicola TaxID=474951 RepID=UPI0021E07E49|nr:hypothetical protein [Granulicella paludicola]
MAESVQNGPQQTSIQQTLIGAKQVAHDVEERRSSNGVRFATYGETGIANVELDRILEAVPAGIVAALQGNTYYFVPLALRATRDETAPAAEEMARVAEPAMVASVWSDELSDAAICHRNVELASGHQGVFISTRLLADRFALSFEFFINVAHAFVDKAGVPQSFSEMVWKQAVENVKGETSLDAWEARNLAFGRAANAMPAEPLAPARRTRAFAPVLRSLSASAGGEQAAIDEKERGHYVTAAFTDAVAIYLLSLALDFNYSDLRERDYPLIAPVALAERLRAVAELFPANPGYEFAVKYRKRA